MQEALNPFVPGSEAAQPLAGDPRQTSGYRSYPNPSPCSFKLT